MPDKKPWEQYSSNQTSQEAKPWEKYSPVSKKKEPTTLESLGKKAMSLSASEEPKKTKAGASESSTIKTQQRAFDESFAVKNQEEKQKESQLGKPDGVYSYPSNPNALYKKEQGKWYIDIGKKGTFQPLKSGDVQKRISQLEKNSDRYFDAEYEQNSNLKFESQPKQNVVRQATPINKEAQKAFEKDFAVLDKNDPVVKKREEIDALSKTASGITWREEEDAVGILRNTFKGTKYDFFDFEEYGAGDKLLVRNQKTGGKIIIDLDNWTDEGNNREAELLRGFLDINMASTEYNDLFQKKQKLLEERGSITGRPQWEVDKYLEKVEEDLRVEDAKRKGYAMSSGDYTKAALFSKVESKNIETEVNRLKYSAIELKTRAEENAAYKKQLSNDLKNGVITPDEYNQKLLDPKFTFEDEQIKKDAQELKSSANNLISLASQNDALAGDYFKIMSERGDPISNVVGSFIKGFTTIGAIAAKDKDPWLNFFDYESNTEFLPGVVTQEYVSSPNRSALEKVMAGLAESTGAIVSSPGSGMFGTIMNSYANFKGQIEQDPNFDKVPEYEKVLLSAIYGGTVGALERYGIGKSLAKTPAGKKLTSWLIGKAFGQVPKGATAETINAAIEGNLKTLIAKGVINTSSASLIEGSTEAAQEIADMTLKGAYDTIKGKDYFDNPKTIGEMVDQTTESFKLGLLGGAVMSGTSQALITPKEVRTNLQLNAIESIISNPDIKSIFENDLKVKVLNGEISAKNAKAQIDEMNESQALFEKIPSHIKDKTESFRLLAEKQKLESEIEGRDKILSTPQLERIKQIDQQLLDISMNELNKQENAIQEQTTDESVLRTEQPEVGLQEVVERDSKQEVAPEQGVEQEVTTEEEITSEPVIASFTDNKGISIQGELEKDTNILSLDTPESISKFTEITGQEFNPSTFKEVYQDNIDSFIESGYGAISFPNEAGEMETVALTQDVITPTEQQQEIEFDDIKSVDVTDKTNLQKVQSYLDRLIGDLDKFGGETLGVNLPVAVAKTVLKTVKTLVDAGVTLENAIKQASNKHSVDSKDIEDTIRAIRQQSIKQRLKQAEAISKPKKVSDASKAAKQISKKPKKMIVIDEAKELVNQIKLEARAARDKKKQVKEVLTTISDSAKAMQTKGKITVRQMNALLSGMKRLNMDNEVAVNRYIDYVQKVISDAEYVQKQSEAASIRKSIKRLSKGKKGGKFMVVSRGFGELNPKWVQDIDQYLEIAKTVKQSLTPTTVRKGDVKFKEEASIKEIGAYTAKEQARQNEVVAENIRIKYEKITGDSGKGKSAGEMKSEMLSPKFAEETDYTDQIKKTLSERLDELKELITEDDIPEIKEAVNIDLKLVDNKTAMRMIDAIDSYIANGSIAGIKAYVADYRGLKNAANSTLKTRNLRLAGLRSLGQLQSEQFSNINIVIDRIFGGAISGLKFKKESGFQDLYNGANKAEREVITKQNEYTKKFSKVKDFNSVDNIYERNIIASLRRNLADGDQVAEFERRKSLLNQSLKRLEKGSDAEKRKAEAYKRVFDKLGVTDENSTLQSIESKASDFNKQAVDFVTEMWAEKYFDLADLAEGVYNTQLARDVNYTPDRFKRLEKSTEIEQVVDGSTFGFSAFNNIVLDKNEAGVLIESKRPSKLPEGRYIDLDFDSNEFRSYRLALNDLYTAEPIRQLSAYLGSEKFNNTVDVDDANILKGMIAGYISAKKGKNFSDKDTTEFFRKFMNYVGGLGAGRALVALSQPILQFSTASVNTIAQVGVNWQPQDLANKDAMNFINNSGYAIANRGLESATTIEKAENSIKFDSPMYKVANYLPKKLAEANTFLLKWSLSKPDVAAARIAWLAYYRQKAKELGIEVDYTKEPNKEAADYAQTMVDRSMDVSDTELRGKFFKDRAAFKVFMKQVYFPFATFALNQKNRMWSDLRVLSDSKATKEDRMASAKSLSGLAFEFVAYNGIRFYLGKLMLEAALSLLDIEDDEKDELRKKYEASSKRNVGTKAFQDLIVPTPVAENYFLKGTNLLMKKTGFLSGDEKEFQKMVDEENERRYLEYQDPLTEDQIEKMRLKFNQENQFQFFVDEEQNFGTLSIQYDKAIETYEMLNALTTGKFTQETQYGDVDKRLTKEGQDQMLLPFAMKLGSTVVLPREFDQVSNRMYKIIKDKHGVTDTQYEKVQELKKMGVDITSDAMKLIKSKKGNKMLIENMYDEIEYINSLSGKEKDAYMKSIGIGK